MLEEGETAFFYPFSVLPYFIASPLHATNIVVFSALFIAMLGMFFWLRYNKASLPAAILGAVAFGCCGSLVFRLKHFNSIHVLAWLPLSMLCIQASAGKRIILLYLGLTCVWLMQILAGHPHVFFICQLVSWVFILLLSITELRSVEFSWRNYIKHFVLVLYPFVLALALALLLGGIQLYSSYDFLHYSNRDIASSLDGISNASLTWKHLLCWLYPFAEGNFSGRFCMASGKSYNLFTEATPYIGCVPLFIAVWSLAGRKRSIAFCLLLLSAMLMWIAFGPQGGLYSLLYNYAPFFASFRAPSRFVAPLGCCLAFLAGLGAQYWYDLLAKRYNELIAKCGLYAVLFVTVADFCFVNWAFQCYLPMQWFSRPPSAALGIERNRVAAPVYTMSWKSQMYQNNYDRREQMCYAHRNQLGSELASLWGIKSPDDYVVYNSGFVLNHSYRLQIILALKTYSFWMTGQKDDSGLVDLGIDYYRLQNVTHVVLPHRLPDGLASTFLDTPAEVREPQYPEISVWVYPLKHTLSRVRIVSDLVDKCPAEILDIDSYWIDSVGESLYEPGRFGTHDIGFAEISSETPNTLTVKTKSDQAGHLFIANTYSPNWQAFLDGSAVPQQVRRTNYAFQSVPLPAGEHTVVLKYTCPAFWRGLWISLSGLAVLLLTAVIGYRCRWL